MKKHFKNVPEPGERSVLEHLIYACCLEDSRYEQADEAFAKLQQMYVDWNEVRVTTVIELGEAMSSLPNAAQAGHRIKRCLQSLFEARYQYDIDDLKKANLSKATDEISSWKGVTPFILNYVSQNALGGHAIPVDSLGIEILVQCDILTLTEVEKKSVPGLERAIPKNKGFEFGSLLHQFAVEFKQSPKNASVLAVFKEFGVSPKPRAIEKPATKKEPKPSSIATPLTTETPTSKKAEKSEPAPTPSTKKTDKPERVSVAVGKSKDAPAKPEPKPESAKAIEANKKTDAKKNAEGRVAEVKTAEVKKPEVKKPEVKKPEVKKPEVKKPEVKKPEVKKPEVKKPEVKKSDKESAGKKQDKPAVKKPDSKSSPNTEKTVLAKVTKPEPLAKKSVTTIRPSASKSDSSTKPTKKKPR